MTVESVWLSRSDSGVGSCASCGNTSLSLLLINRCHVAWIQKHQKNIMSCCHAILDVACISNVRHDFVTSPFMCFLQASGSVTVADLDIASRTCYEQPRPVPRQRIMFSIGRRGGPTARRKSAGIRPGVVSIALC